MIRLLHKIPGIFAALLVLVMAGSGTILSVMPALQAANVAPSAGLSVQHMLVAVERHVQNIREIRRLPSGAIIVAHSHGFGFPKQDIVDPRTGVILHGYHPSRFMQEMIAFHRSLFLGFDGRMAGIVAALALLFLSVSGMMLIARKNGGWRFLFSRIRSTGLSRIHSEVGRLAFFGLAISSVTALWLSAATFGVVGGISAASFTMPPQASGAPALPAARLSAFTGIPLSSLRDLQFPMPQDKAGTYAVTTGSGNGYVDPGTGKMLRWTANSTMQNLYQFIYRLHAGQGMWLVGLFLGLCALSVPLMSFSGLVIWWRKRRARVHLSDSRPAREADTIILVGSEGNATWGFARALQEGLAATGRAVHISAMNSVLSHYPRARDVFLLSSTYGNGDAPASANAFLQKFRKCELPSDARVSVLGFGDRQFPEFCGFARKIDAVVSERQIECLLPLETIDRQSSQEFHRWGKALGEAMGCELDLVHTVDMPPTVSLELVSRREYGTEVQAPTTVFRFALPASRRSLMSKMFARSRAGRFSAGDLLGIFAPGAAAPRYYSLASSEEEGFVEICVRKHLQGICSSHLHGLEPGDRITAFFKANPEFHPAKSRAPVILVGAGTGIAPLAGMIRMNRSRRGMYLYFGARDPQSDFLYEEELSGWMDRRHLWRLRTAFSRVKRKEYVQDAIRQDAEILKSLISRGAQIMVCGGREMAAGVGEAFEAICEACETSLDELRFSGRYREDVY